MLPTNLYADTISDRSFDFVGSFAGAALALAAAPRVSAESHAEIGSRELEAAGTVELLLEHD
jgi:hypothetical protein